MNRPHIEVADVFRGSGPEFFRRYGPTISHDQRRILKDITRCRTAALGGHAEECESCGHRRIAYNSCRNRHCPKCQAGARAAWMEARAADLLPVPYFHVVFTMPKLVAELALQNKRVVYGILFQAAAATLTEVAADPRHLGAEIGFLAVLHTWGQNLMHHPHVHCVVPAGGVSPDRSRWVPCRQSASSGKLFFLPVRILSRVFRGKFIHALKQAFARGKLRFYGRLAPLADERRFEAFLNTAVRSDWVVHAKRPFGGPEQVLKYLARYTHRVAISNSRLVDYSDDKVTFRWKNYAAGGRQQEMRVEAVEFIRRFLLHTLPGGFQRIRHFGFLANRNRSDMLVLCRKLLNAHSPQEPAPMRTSRADTIPDGERQSVRCPVCMHGRIIVIELLPPASTGRVTPQPPHFLVQTCAVTVDSS